MFVFTAAKLFVFRILWQWFGISMFGDGLIDGLDSDDENIRTLAGMFLVQTRQRSRPLILDALTKGDNLPTLLTILGDIGDAKIASTLERYTHSSDPEIVRAADDALKVVKLRQQKSGSLSGQ